MARLLDGRLSIVQIRQWYWTWKAHLSIKNCFYQHQNITIIVKGESETCPISEIAIIILFLKFIGSFEAAAFPFTNWFFPPSCFSLLSSGLSHCCPPHFTPTASRKKTSSKKNYLRDTLRLIEDLTRRRTEENFPSADWHSYLRTQLTVFVGEICLRSKQIFSALFSENNIFTRRRHFKELQVKGNLFDCSQIWTLASLAYNKWKRVCEFFISKFFFSRAIFVRSLHTFF